MKTYHFLLIAGFFLMGMAVLTACDSTVIDAAVNAIDKAMSDNTTNQTEDNQTDNFTRPIPPLIKALDADGDRILSAAEIDNATAALKTLDANGDGQLTPDELFLPRPECPDEDNITSDNDTQDNGTAKNQTMHPPVPGMGIGHGGPGWFGPPPVAVLMMTLDTDRDGILSAAEIDNATAALKTLDTNEDGQVTPDELLPPRPECPDEDNITPDNDTRPVPPLIKALDADGDRILSAAEIDNATAALKTLDANGDGQLTPEEIFPSPAGDSDNSTSVPHGHAWGRATHGRFGPPAHPLLKALDADGDRILSAAEIDNATAVLKALDVDGDGTLTPHEMWPRPECPDDNTTADNDTEDNQAMHPPAPGMGMGHGKPGRSGPPRPY